VAAGLLAATFALLSGCAPSTEFAIFEREQTANDVLPDSFSGLELSEDSLESSRLSGTYGDLTIYLVRGGDAPGGLAPCLAIDAASGPGVFCGGIDGEVSTRFPGGTVIELVGDREPEDAGWTSVGPNVRARD